MINSTYLLLPFFTPKFLAQQPNLELPQFMFFSYCESRSFNTIQNNKHNRRAVYFNLYVAKEGKG